jgi:hypothetical protein
MPLPTRIPERVGCRGRDGNPTVLGSDVRTLRQLPRTVTPSGSIASRAWPVQAILRGTRERGPLGRRRRAGVAALKAREAQSAGSSTATATLHRASCLRSEAIPFNDGWRSLDTPAT